MAGDPLGTSSPGTSVPLSPWRAPTAPLTLRAGQAQLWRFRLDLAAAELDTLQTLLNREELQRAERLRIPDKRAQFIAARGRLRQILARYLGQPPGQFEFAYGEHGKPHLPSAQFAFNLAHAGHWGVLLVSGAGEAGVDVEVLDRDLEHDKVAAHYFSDAERALWQRCSPGRRARGFFRIWTRKEALLKAAGGGFATAPQADAWQLRSFALERGYLGAAALPPGVTGIIRWHFA